jgi:phosphoribosyl 1,2-cyclic phosphodiesterase
MPPQFEMDALYVGQGDGICIQCGGRTFMIDGGCTTKDQLAKYTLVPYLHCRGIRKLDGVILTHDDADLCSGLIELLEALVPGETEEEGANQADMALVKSADSISEASTAMGETEKCTHEATTAPDVSKSEKMDVSYSGNILQEGSSLTDPVPIGAIYLPDIAAESEQMNIRNVSSRSRFCLIMLRFF